MSAPEYGHNPYGAMFDCTDCGQRFRTVERLRDHQDFDQGQMTTDPALLALAALLVGLSLGVVLGVWFVASTEDDQ